MKKCSCCEQDKPIEEFANGGAYKTKNGEVKHYKRKTCKACYSGENREPSRRKEHKLFHQLTSWPTIAAALLIVTGIYSHDYVKGRNRICFYESVVGDHAVTIDAMRMCPGTWRFEV